MKSQSIGQSFYLHYDWKFLLADAYPLSHALNKWKDADGSYFYEPDYNEHNWQTVTLPHTFNDVDLFRARIQDAGSGKALFRCVHPRSSVRSCRIRQARRRGRSPRWSSSRSGYFQS